MRISPLHIENYLKEINIDQEQLFELLKNNINWVDPSRSIAKHRLSYNFFNLLLENEELFRTLESEILPIMEKCLNVIIKHYKFTGKIGIAGVFLNYQRDGNDYTPSHIHKDTAQFVLAVGKKRKLFVNKKNYLSGEGSLTFFGSSPHGVEKEKDEKGERISIAVFLQIK